MIYRKSCFSDCKAIYSLICDLEGKVLSYNKFEEIYNNQIEDPCYYCLVCEQDNHVIGMLNLRFEAQLHHSERIAEILEFVTKPECRSKGIGKEMFAQSCEIAKSNGCLQIEVACNQIRKETHRFYLRENMHNSHFKFFKRLVDDV